MTDFRDKLRQMANSHELANFPSLEKKRIESELLDLSFKNEIHQIIDLCTIRIIPFIESTAKNGVYFINFTLKDIFLEHLERCCELSIFIEMHRSGKDGSKRIDIKCERLLCPYDNIYFRIALFRKLKEMGLRASEINIKIGERETNWHTYDVEIEGISINWS